GVGWTAERDGKRRAGGIGNTQAAVKQDNTCQTAKPGAESAEGARQGRGGGFMEREEVVEYRKSARDDDDIWDEFGRLKKKKKQSGDVEEGRGGNSAAEPTRRIEAPDASRPEVRRVKSAGDEGDGEDDDDDDGEDDGRWAAWDDIISGGEAAAAGGKEGAEPRGKQREQRGSSVAAAAAPFAFEDATTPPPGFVVSAPTASADAVPEEEVRAVPHLPTGRVLGFAQIFEQERALKVCARELPEGARHGPTGRRHPEARQREAFSTGLPAILPEAMFSTGADLEVVDVGPRGKFGCYAMRRSASGGSLCLSRLVKAIQHQTG
ncbi:MAG: hypothetical protein BJ554DRAFT_7269, partial [Olpidium bornovanus]